MAYRLASSRLAPVRARLSHSGAQNLQNLHLRLRLLATHARAPCSDYLNTTHPDGDASQGSKVASTLDRFSHTVLATYSRPQILFTRGSGLDLYAAADPNTNDGHNERKYLDFSSGIAVNSLGHSDPQIAEIAADQSSRLVHASNLYHNEWSGELADRMVSLTHQHGGLGFQKGSNPTDSGLKVFLANSGTEANEAALKFARKAAKNDAGSDKTQLVSFTNAFHGRTMGALAMTPNPKYQAPFAPLIGDVVTGEYNSLEGLDTLITSKTAGVIVEPVQGEGGIFPAKLEWLQALRKRCDEVGALLIFDEIQCGLFRSGTLWCHSEFPVDAHPDMVTMAKPLANGFPIGAVLMRDRVAHLIAVGDHGTTFGGGPFTSRIAHHVLGRMSTPEFVVGIKNAHETLVARLRALVQLFPDLIRDEPKTGKASPRGKGLLLGLSMKDPAHAGRVVALARHRGLLILSAGSDALRILPSLTVTVEQINKAVDILESSLLVLRDEVSPSPSPSSSGSVPTGKRAYSTSTRSSSSSTDAQTLYERFNALAESWPKDPLRPDLDFGAAISSAANTALRTSEGAPRDLSAQELQFARNAYDALEAMRDNKVTHEFPTPQSILKPQSAPQYYDRLLKTLDAASQGKKLAPSFAERVRRFFGSS